MFKMYLQDTGLPLANSLMKSNAQVEIAVFKVRAKMAELSVRTTTNTHNQKWRRQQARTLIELRLF